MAHTNFGLLLDEQKTVWSRDVWKQARELMFLNRFMNRGPNSMVQRVTELTESERGSRAVISLVADLEGDGVVGDSQLEGNEEEVKAYDQVIEIDQMRHANRLQGRMAEQKTVIRFRENSRDVLAHWLSDRLDQLAFLTLSGELFSQTTAGGTRVGSAFSSLAWAPTSAKVPTARRHFNWETNALEAANTASTTITVPVYNMLLDMKAKAKTEHIRPIRGEGGRAMYFVFMTPEGMAELKKDTVFHAALRDALPRRPSNPLFQGADVYFVDGLAIYEFEHVYHADTWGAGSATGQAVLLCGAQALGFADLGMPEWVEKRFDYDNQPGIAISKICGMLKPTFRSNVSGTDEDFGVIRVNTLR